MMSNRESVVNQQVAEASVMYRGVMSKAYAGKASPRSAIRAMCLSCVGYLRDEVTDCTGYSCPLWKYRPYQQNAPETGAENV